MAPKNEKIVSASIVLTPWTFSLKKNSCFSFSPDQPESFSSVPE